LEDRIIKCPRCGKETDFTENPFRPFCSQRCKMIDLGNWAMGVYRVPGTEASEEETPASETPRESEEE